MPCAVNGCGLPAELVYYRHEVCLWHWLKHCDGVFNLKDYFEVKE